jgi:hypothetical protein
MPHTVGAFAQRQAPQLVSAASIEQAQFDLIGAAGKHRKIAALGPAGRPERVRRAGERDFRQFGNHARGSFR